MRVSRPVPRATCDDVGPDLGRQLADLVDVADLQGEEGVGRVLDQLGRRGVGGDQRYGAEVLRPRHDGRRRERLVQDRPVQPVQHLEPAGVVGADHDAVGVEGVVDGRAFPQELRVGGHGQRAVGHAVVVALVGLAHDGVDPVAAADRDGRLVHHDRETGPEVLADRGRGRFEVAQVRAAVGQGRRVDRDEHHVAVGHRVGVLGGEAEVVGRLGHQLGQVRFEDGGTTGPQRLDFGRVDVDAGDVVTEQGEAGAGGQAYVARTNHRDLHCQLLARAVGPEQTTAVSSVPPRPALDRNSGTHSSDLCGPSTHAAYAHSCEGSDASESQLTGPRLITRRGGRSGSGRCAGRSPNSSCS